ncbi:MAG: hypothetical protein ACE5JG_11340 [Planctomycetota bacterium]
MRRSRRAQLALLCSEDERVRQALAGAGFRILPAMTAGKALTLLEKEAVDLVVADVGTDPRTIDLLNVLPGHRRRKLFAVLLGAGYKTGDRMQAWRESVNLVVNPEDLGDFEVRVRERMAEEEEFYRPLQQAVAGLEPASG